MPRKSQPLHDAIRAFDRSAIADSIRAAEKKRREIVQEFPLEEWPHMPLEKYALGHEASENSFSYQMEFASQELGSMRGGTARKLMIYKHKNKPGWFYDDKLFSSEQEAWEAIRAGFVEAFELARSGDWNAIDQAELLPWGPAICLKSLHLYFPDQALPVYSRDHLRHYLNMLDRPEGKERSYDALHLNRALREALREIPELEGWSTFELMRLLYFWADPRESRRIVKIAPGKQAEYWSDCLGGDYICVAWDETGDLRDFEDKESFVERFSELFKEGYKNNMSTVTRKANELWTLTELEPGDLVVANRGISHIMAIGEVQEPGYSYSETRDKFKHLVSIKWDTSFEKDISPQKSWALNTVLKLSSALYAQLVRQREETIIDSEVPVDAIYLQIADALERKGQVVLYGPPGTGKTYLARRFCVWWLLRQQGHESPQTVLADDEEFVEAERSQTTVQVAKRVWWVVANKQQWSWDSLFEEGSVEYRQGRLKRNYPLVQEGDLVVGYQSSPDKRIVALARIKKGLHTVEGGESKILIEPLLKIKNGPTYEELKADPMLASSEPMRFRSQGTLFQLNEEEADSLFALLEENNPQIEKYFEDSSSVGQLTNLTFHASYSYEDFIEGIRPVQRGDTGFSLSLQDGVFKRICREAQANPDRPYLVLIDEINRANVAKVFGELITILEQDKRGLTITLPQSKESFSIPPNVYVLGTMNTADRSIKLLDAAFRRRFAFLEFMPDSSILSGAKVGNLHLDEFLDELNRRVARIEGREKQIGHSYLLDQGQPVTDPDEFARRFRQEILPLLQEYCYDEYATLARYIGDKLVNEDAQSLDLETVMDTEKLLLALEDSFLASE